MERQSLAYGVFYWAWLLVAWAVFVAVALPLFGTQPSLGNDLLKGALRIGIFAVPVFVLARAWHPSALAALGISTGWKRGIGVGFAAGVLWAFLAIAVGVLLEGKSVRLPASAVMWLTGFSVSTLVEELAFRSYLLQVFLRRGAALAVVLSSVAFVSIHYPGWYLLGMMPSASAWLMGSASLFVLGCVLAALFLKTRSIWACVVLHALNNLAAAVLSPYGMA